MTDNVVSRLKSNRIQGRPRGPSGALPSGITPGVYYADLTLGGRVITVKLLRKHDSGTQARYLYTTHLSLSGEEACLAGDRGPQRDVKAHSSFWGLQGYLTTFTVNNVLRELVGELNLGSVEAFLRSSNVI